MSNSLPRIVVTGGEPAGIGPDIIVKLARHHFNAEIVVVGDLDLIAERASRLRTELDIREFDNTAAAIAHSPGSIRIVAVKLVSPVTIGNLDTANSAYVLETIDKAVDQCHNAVFDAMVTTPVHKGIINDSGIPFSGHTEWIAQRCGAKHPVMMLARGDFRVCLATIHLPLARVPDNITRESLTSTLEVIATDLEKLYGIDNPRIAVCGLNPHAGEGGHLGNEEIETITPVIDSLKSTGMRLVGPLPADTAFTREKLDQFDAVLAMYHDQGLPVIKHAGFGNVVNVTLGLPVIRTSVDHGTALDIAGTGTASETSLVAAINLAIEYANNRRQ